MAIKASLAIATILTAVPAEGGDKSTNRSPIVAPPTDTVTDTAIAARRDSAANAPGATFAQNRRRRPPAPQTQSPPRSPGPSQMANPAAVARPAGIYLASGGQLVRLEFNVTGQTRTGGLFGTIITGGIAHATLRVVLQGETARVRTSERSPTFYFYLPDAVAAANRSSFEPASPTGAPTSPNEFSLIRLVVRQGRREARVGRANIGGIQSGVIDRDRIGFRYENPRPGVYSVNTDAPLEPGEYSFVMIGSGGARQARFFDFSVQ